MQNYHTGWIIESDTTLVHGERFSQFNPPRRYCRIELHSFSQNFPNICVLHISNTHYISILEKRNIKNQYLGCGVVGGSSAACVKLAANIAALLYRSSLAYCITSSEGLNKHCQHAKGIISGRGGVGGDLRL